MTGWHTRGGALTRLLVFVGGAAVCLAVSIATAGILSGLIGAMNPAAMSGIVSALFSGLLLLWSRHLLRRRDHRLKSLGLPTTAERLRQCGVGLAISVPLFVGVAGMQSLVVGASWYWLGSASVVRALSGALIVLALVLAEELLFRGVALQALRDFAGDRAAVLLSAVCFGAYHLVGSHDWAMGAVFRFALSALGGVLFGWAAVRSGGLALPIGLHWGGNWVQANVAVFQPPWQAATASMPAVWRIPVTAHDVQALTAPDLVTRLPYLGALSLCAIAVVMVSRSKSRHHLAI